MRAKHEAVRITNLPYGSRLLVDGSQWACGFAQESLLGPGKGYLRRPEPARYDNGPSPNSRVPDDD
jgi:hypothetical protein